MSSDIGLTGNIASGKSMISGILREYGAAVLDADLIGKRVLAEDVDGALDQVRTAFGNCIFEGSQLNRHLLGTLVFGHPDLLTKLNGIMVPIMTKLVVDGIRLLHQTSTIVILDAAILIEAGWQSLVDEIWVVKASKEDQLERLMTRDHLTRNEAVSRIDAQMPLTEKLVYADIIIDNTMNAEQTRKQVEILWKTRLQNR
ncbi:MAG: dephospho-CoA kinase [Caldiserica bacterium]|nr:dephospho-CoA kinase [Caldisericota bacterium]